MYGPYSDLIVKSEERGSETLHHLPLDLGRAVVWLCSPDRVVMEYAPVCPDEGAS